MKILLTAPPRTGKSTIIENFIQLYGGNKVGILAKQITDSNNERVGFKSINLKGDERVFMHIYDINSDIVIGNKYKVDVDVVDNFVVPEITQSVETGTVIIVDEIGKAQSSSSKFLQAVKDLLNSDKNVLFTILYEDEDWARGFKEHPEAIILEVTIENRDMLPEILVEVYSNLSYFEKLSKEQKDFVIEEFKQFLKNNELDRAKKLFKNAVPYYVLNKIKKIDDKSFLVEGNTNKHIVIVDDNTFKCDCDLFNGKGKFTGKASTCSHIDSIRIGQIS